MIKRIDKNVNPLLSEENMAEHVQLAIEGSTGRAVESARIRCADISLLQERSSRAATRIVLGIDEAGLRLAIAQGQKLEARVKEMLEDPNETPASIAALLKRYADRMRFLKREQRRKGRTEPEGMPEGESDPPQDIPILEDLDTEVEAA